MPIQRVESLTYGVADMERCTRYWEDVGLEKVEAGAAGATFRTPTNQFVHLRKMDDPSLPPAPDPGPTLREAVWGVDSRAAQEALAAELSKDREVKRSADGVVHSHDETGYALAFALSNPTVDEPEKPQYNSYDRTVRVNRRVARRERLRPTRIGHVVYDIKAEDREKASAFYLDRLGFRLTDRNLRVGDFMRVPGVADHHAVLLMWIRQQVVRFNHAAFELPGFDDIMYSGEYMPAKGWKAIWGPGRQPLGCHIFWHFENPCGGELEFFADMDRFDDSWQPVEWKENSAGNIWGEPPPDMKRAKAAAGH